jgi:hypothetical protein
MTRCGENHTNAKLTDDEVELLRSLRESELHLTTQKRFWTLRRLAEKFEISRRQVVNIVGYHHRVSRED